LSAFENQPIRTVVIKNWPNDDFLYHVFLRLNTGSVPLSPQELRQALHPGKFVSFLDKSSSESIALQEILKLKKPDFRMRDAELLLRYYAFKNFINNYAGTLKNFLDDCCSHFNDTWDSDQEKIEEQLNSFELAHQAIKSVFSKHSYRKWTGSTYENRFNRAVFDILILSFSEEDTREYCRGKEQEVENAFKYLCTEDRAFITSLETTTKSIRATDKRISTWNSKLNEVLGINLPVPNLVGRLP